MVQATRDKLAFYRIDSGSSLLFFLFILAVEFMALVIHAEPAVHASITTMGGLHGFGHYIHHVSVDVQHIGHDVKEDLSRL